MRKKHRIPPSRDDRTVAADDTDHARHLQPVASAQRLQRVIESRELFRGESEILISHDGAIYRMKITRQGKLILNK